MFFKRADARVVEMFPGVVRRSLGWGASLLVAEFSYSPGGSAPAHSHPYEQLTYVVEGEYLVSIAGEERLVKKGDAYLVPAGVEHSQRAEVRTVTADSWSPPRPDYRDRTLGPA